MFLQDPLDNSAEDVPIEHDLPTSPDYWVPEFRSNPQNSDFLATGDYSHSGHKWLDFRTNAIGY